MLHKSNYKKKSSQVTLNENILKKVTLDVNSTINVCDDNKVENYVEFISEDNIGKPFFTNIEPPKQVIDDRFEVRDNATNKTIPPELYSEIEKKLIEYFNAIPVNGK